MNVTGTRAASFKLSTALPGETPRHDDATESRALVAVTPAAETTHEPLAAYRSAAFLAQLIANREQLPQTRERRRAEPGEAIVAYRAVAAMTAKH